MAKKPKVAAPGEWRYTVEQLTAYERLDRGLAIYTRIPAGSGKGYRDKLRLRGPIRDATGRILPELEAEAITMAVARQKRLAAGMPEDVPDAPLTLELAFRRMLHDREGKYAGNTDRKRDVERRSATVMGVLGRDILCAAITRAHYRKLWRALAHEHAKEGTYGPEAAVKIVGVLRALVAWLLEEGILDTGTLPAASWKATMRKEWTEITSRPVNPPRKARYTPAEQARLWARLPDADPRLELAAQVGAELRLGQVIRSRRSDVLPYGGHAIGRVRVHGSGRKAGAEPILTMQARHVVTRALTSGYLADLEAAYRKGAIPDYYLVPGGRLHGAKTRRGLRLRARVENAGRHWERTPMRRAWARLEQLAGVESIRGRRWYGLRRLSADLAEDVEKDDRALNETGGWTDSATRRKYQEKGRSDIAERARTVRERIRPRSRKVGA